MKLPLTNEEFEYIYSRVPRLNVEVIIQTDKGMVLTKRSIEPWNAYWHIPGGTVYMDETLEEAVVRVALHETGLHVAVDTMVGYLTYPGIKEQNSYGWPVGIAFLAHRVGGELRGSEVGEEIGEFTILPEKFIEDQKIFLEQKKLI